MKPIIQVSGLSKTFGGFTAVDEISFSVFPGEILGFVGPNGAGKTTTIKMMIGLMKSTSGRIEFRGLELWKNRKQIKRMLGYMSQKFSLYPLLTPAENIDFFAGVSGLPRAEIKQKKQAILTTLPQAVARRMVKDIPPGFRQRIALAVSLITDPEILLLDEPTSGVDPEVRRDFWIEIYGLKQEGKTILVTTHNLDEVEYADRILIIHRGRLIMEGEPDLLKKQHEKATVAELFKQAVLDSGGAE